jgi:hypothetical protein
MNIELDEVVQNVSDDALELAAGGGGYRTVHSSFVFCGSWVLAIADR